MKLFEIAKGTVVQVVPVNSIDLGHKAGDFKCQRIFHETTQDNVFELEEMVSDPADIHPPAELVEDAEVKTIASLYQAAGMYGFMRSGILLFAEPYKVNVV